MTPRILAISTSPRRHGNSESALDTVLAEIGDRFPSEKVVLGDLAIAPCKGCGACERLGRCVQEDDFQALSQKILDADVLILATPVYSMSVDPRNTGVLHVSVCPGKIPDRSLSGVLVAEICTAHLRGTSRKQTRPFHRNRRTDTRQHL